MKHPDTAGPPVENIDLLAPRYEGSRVHYTWSQNPLLDEQGFWLEYPGLDIDPSPTPESIAPYLPICIAFAVLGGISVRLPYRLPEKIFERWEKTIRDTAQAVYKKKEGFRLINGVEPLQIIPWKGEKTALLFGGGSEALLTLGRLMGSGVKPILVSYEGPRWDGADPEKNPHKFELEEQLAAEFGLTRIRIGTPFFELIYKPAWDWSKYLSHNMTGIILAALFQPFVTTGLLPVARILNLQMITNGAEKDNESSIGTYCFWKQSTQNLERLSDCVNYRADLQDFVKAEIVRDLHLKFESVAKYQYSCLANRHERWCLRCEKCFRSLLSFVIFDIPLSRVGIDPTAFVRNLPAMMQKTRDALRKKPVLTQEYNGFLREAQKVGSREGLRLIESVLKNLRWIILRDRAAASLRALGVFSKSDPKQS